MHSEHYYIADETIEKIEKANKDNIPVICVGTTSFRAVQSFAKLTKDKTGENILINGLLPIYSSIQKMRHLDLNLGELMDL